MELRTAASPKDVKMYTTERLREEFLIDDLFHTGRSSLYTAISTALSQVPQCLWSPLR